jgi:hypothetical protein
MAEGECPAWAQSAWKNLLMRPLPQLVVRECRRNLPSNMSWSKTRKFIKAVLVEEIKW